jgi:hypothetical protein
MGGAFCIDLRAFAWISDPMRAFVCFGIDLIISDQKMGLFI